MFPKGCTDQTNKHADVKKQIVVMMIHDVMKCMINCSHDQEMEISTMTFWCRMTFLHYLPTYLWTRRLESRLAKKAFQDDWFNKEYNLNITEADR